MIDFTKAPVPVRGDITEAMNRDLERLRRAGGSLDGARRVSLARRARVGTGSDPLESLAAKLYSDPASVTGEDVEAAASSTGYPEVVETIGIVARLSAVDRFHSVLGVDLPPVPEPLPGMPTGQVTPGLKKRVGHVPMPPGPIPVSLDLVPAEGEAVLDLHGSIYMTEEDMGDPSFGRTPGLDTPQLEAIAARVSYLNECFY